LAMALCAIRPVAASACDSVDAAALVHAVACCSAHTDGGRAKA